MPSRYSELDEIDQAFARALAADPEGPRVITFRYERGADGVWSGGYSIETHQQYEELVKARKALDAKLTEALRKHFAAGVETVSLTYGVRSWAEPGPKLVISKAGEPRASFNDPDPELWSLWHELLELLKGRGFRHVYRADMTLDKPKARLREGDNLRVRYGK
jgi:hypothetical protein